MDQHVIDAFVGMLCGLVGTMLLVSATTKVRHRIEFRGIVVDYRIVPESCAGAAAVAVIVLEAAVALLVLAGIASGFAMAAVLFGLFAAAIAVNLIRGRKAIDCGCTMGGRRRPISWRLAAGNMTLSVAAGIVAGALVVPLAGGLPAMTAHRAIGLIGGACLIALGHGWGMLANTRPKFSRT